MCGVGQIVCCLGRDYQNAALDTEANKGIYLGRFRISKQAIIICDKDSLHALLPKSSKQSGQSFALCDTGTARPAAVLGKDDYLLFSKTQVFGKNDQLLSSCRILCELHR